MMQKDKLDFYQKLRAKTRKKGRKPKGKWAEYILLAPDMFHLLCKLLIDKDVPKKEKAKVAAAIAYFVTPFDFLIDIFTGPLGYLDDIAVTAYVLNSIVNSTDPDIVRRHWAGDGDILEITKSILDLADEMLGSGLWNRLRKIIG